VSSFFSSLWIQQQLLPGVHAAAALALLDSFGERFVPGGAHQATGSRPGTPGIAMKSFRSGPRIVTAPSEVAESAVLCPGSVDASSSLNVDESGMKPSVSRDAFPKNVSLLYRLRM
jgi:hypothetical protein